MVPLLRPNVLSYNQGRRTSSGSVPSTHVAVDHSLILQLSRLVCLGSLGPHPPLGSARYIYVRGRGVCVCVFREVGRVGEHAVLFYGCLCSYLLPPTLTLSPFLLLSRVRRVLIFPGSLQPTRLGQSQNTLSTLASSPSWEHSQAPWHLPVSTVAWAALASCPTANWPPHTLTPLQNLPSSSVLQPRMTRGGLYFHLMHTYCL